MEAHKRFAHHLKRFRVEQKISQAKMGELLGIKQASVSGIEQGRVSQFRIDFIEKAMAVTGKSFEELIEEVVEEEEKEGPKERYRSPSPVPKEKQVKRLPKKLFTGSRIEARQSVQTEGFAPRVDLFETVEEVINFLGGPPCDVYQVKASSLFRKYMEKIEHPMWNLYSYHEHINHDRIIGMVTYRDVRNK